MNRSGLPERKREATETEELQAGRKRAATERQGKREKERKREIEGGGGKCLAQVRGIPEVQHFSPMLYTCLHSAVALRGLMIFSPISPVFHSKPL